MMGDHCYNLGQADDRRGDAYMNAMQPLLAVCPWIPIIGNHEMEDGDKTYRFLNSTWGMAYGGNPLNTSTSRSSATSALGHLLTKGSYLGQGLHGTTPSGTSNYFSVNIGLIHIAALSTQHPNGTELEWLTKDLEAANKNRKAVPWIIVTSHYPIYIPSMESDASALGWHSDAGEVCTDGICNGTEYMSCAEAGEAEGCKTVGEEVDESSAATQDLFNRYGVDVYDAGHSHHYAVTWPMLGKKETQTNYSNPQGTIYITEGNGGVPNTGPNGTITKTHLSSWGRMEGTGGAYGIFTTSSADTLTYTHIWNNGNDGKGKVMDTWSLTEATHVQPLAPPTPPPPPPPPLPPPAPPPAGYAWTCFVNQSCGSVPGLKDTNYAVGEPTFTVCEETCNALKDCVAVRYHAADKHCHTLTGPTAPTLAAFQKLLKPAPLYHSCIMLKD